MKCESCPLYETCVDYGVCCFGEYGIRDWCHRCRKREACQNIDGIIVIAKEDEDLLLAFTVDEEIGRATFNPKVFEILEKNMIAVLAGAIEITMERNYREDLRCYGTWQLWSYRTVICVECEFQRNCESEQERPWGINKTERNHGIVWIAEEADEIRS